MLLGGVESKYKNMYDAAIAVVKKHLLFRPMTLDDRDILMSGSFFKSDIKERLLPEGTHLTCFAGGMMGIASRIFDRPAELELAAKITDGCVWAYESTRTGIMPEGFVTVPCDDAGLLCGWNQTRYWDALDPYWHVREERRANESAGQAVLAGKGRSRLPAADAEHGTASAKGSQEQTETPTKTEAKQKKPEQDDSLFRKLRRRQVGEDSESDRITIDRKHREGDEDVDQKRNEVEETASLPAGPLRAEAERGSTTPKTATTTTTSSLGGKDKEKDKDKDKQDSSKEEEIDLTSKYTYRLPPPLTHEEYVKSRIEEERLPPGFVSFQSRKYILRCVFLSHFFFNLIVGCLGGRAFDLSMLLVFGDQVS